MAHESSLTSGNVHSHVAQQREDSSNPGKARSVGAFMMSGLANGVSSMMGRGTPAPTRTQDQAVPSPNADKMAPVGKVEMAQIIATVVANPGENAQRVLQALLKAVTPDIQSQLLGKLSEVGFNRGDQNLPRIIQLLTRLNSSQKATLRDLRELQLMITQFVQVRAEETSSAGMGNGGASAEQTPSSATSVITLLRKISTMVSQTHPIRSFQQFPIESISEELTGALHEVTEIYRSETGALPQAVFEAKSALQMQMQRGPDFLSEGKKVLAAAKEDPSTQNVTKLRKWISDSLKPTESVAEDSVSNVLSLQFAKCLFPNSSASDSDVGYLEDVQRTLEELQRLLPPSSDARPTEEFFSVLDEMQSALELSEVKSTLRDDLQLVIDELLRDFQRTANPQLVALIRNLEQVHNDADLGRLAMTATSTKEALEALRTLLDDPAQFRLGAWTRESERVRRDISSLLDELSPEGQPLRPALIKPLANALLAFLRNQQAEQQGPLASMVQGALREVRGEVPALMRDITQEITKVADPKLNTMGRILGELEHVLSSENSSRGFALKKIAEMFSAIEELTPLLVEEESPLRIDASVRSQLRRQLDAIQEHLAAYREALTTPVEDEERATSAQQASLKEQRLALHQKISSLVREINAQLREQNGPLYNLVSSFFQQTMTTGLEYARAPLAAVGISPDDRAGPKIDQPMTQDEFEGIQDGITPFGLIQEAMGLMRGETSMAEAASKKLLQGARWAARQLHKSVDKSEHPEKEQMKASLNGVISLVGRALRAEHRNEDHFQQTLGQLSEFWIRQGFIVTIEEAVEVTAWAADQRLNPVDEFLTLGRIQAQGLELDPARKRSRKMTQLEAEKNTNAQLRATTQSGIMHAIYEGYKKAFGVQEGTDDAFGSLVCEAQSRLDGGDSGPRLDQIFYQVLKEKLNQRNVGALGRKAWEVASEAAIKEMDRRAGALATSVRETIRTVRDGLSGDAQHHGISPEPIKYLAGMLKGYVGARREVAHGPSSTADSDEAVRELMAKEPRYNHGMSRDDILKGISTRVAEAVKPSFAWTDALAAINKGMSDWAADTTSFILHVLKTAITLPFRITIWIVNNTIVRLAQTIANAISGKVTKKLVVDSNSLQSGFDTFKSTVLDNSQTSRYLMNSFFVKVLEAGEEAFESEGFDKTRLSKDDPIRREMEKLLVQVAEAVKVHKAKTDDEVLRQQREAQTPSAPVAGRSFPFSVVDAFNSLKGSVQDLAEPIVRETLIDMFIAGWGKLLEKGTSEVILGQVLEEFNAALLRGDTPVDSSGQKAMEDRLYTGLDRLIHRTCQRVKNTAANKVGQDRIKTANEHIKWVRSTLLGETSSSSVDQQLSEALVDSVASSQSSHAPVRAQGKLAIWQAKLAQGDESPQVRLDKLINIQKEVVAFKNEMAARFAELARDMGSDSDTFCYLATIAAGIREPLNKFAENLTLALDEVRLELFNQEASPDHAQFGAIVQTIGSYQVAYKRKAVAILHQDAARQIADFVREAKSTSPNVERMNAQITSLQQTAQLIQHQFAGDVEEQPFSRELGLMRSCMESGQGRSDQPDSRLEELAQKPEQILQAQRAQSAPLPEATRRELQRLSYLLGTQTHAMGESTARQPQFVDTQLDDIKGDQVQMELAHTSHLESLRELDAAIEAFEQNGKYQNVGPLNQLHKLIGDGAAVARFEALLNRMLPEVVDNRDLSFENLQKRTELMRYYQVLCNQGAKDYDELIRKFILALKEVRNRKLDLVKEAMEMQNKRLEVLSRAAQPQSTEEVSRASSAPRVESMRSALTKTQEVTREKAHPRAVFNVNFIPQIVKNMFTARAELEMRKHMRDALSLLMDPAISESIFFNFAARELKGKTA